MSVYIKNIMQMNQGLAILHWIQLICMLAIVGIIIYVYISNKTSS
jgi:hypothetical protein